MSRRSEQIRLAREAARLKAEQEAAANVTDGPETVQPPEVETSTEQVMVSSVTPIDRGQLPKCGAKRRQGGAPCGKPAGWGTDHVGFGRCKMHGGSTPNHLKSVANARAEAALVALGRPNVGADAQAELLGMVAEASGNVRTLRQWVEDLADGVTQSVFVAGGYENLSENVLVEMYGKWCDRLVSYSAQCIRAGVSERVVKVMEEQAEMCARVVTAMLDDPELGLSWEQRDLGRRIAGRHLRSLPVGA